MAEKELQLTVRVNAETGQMEVVSQKLRALSGEAEKAGKSAGIASSGMKDLVKAFGGLATAGAVVSFFKSAVAGAEEENQAMRRLKFAVEAAGQSFTAAQSQIDAWSKGIQQVTRFTDGQAIETMGKFVRVTGDTTQAQKASQLAMSLSVATGKDLATTTDILTNLINKNERGVMMARKEFGSFIAGAENGQQVLDILNAKFKDTLTQEEGLTSASASLKNNFGELKDSIGNVLIPVITFLVGWLNKGVDGIRAVGDSLAALGAMIFTTVGGISQIVVAIIKRDFSSIAGIAKTTWEKILNITEESSEMIRGEFEKTTAVSAIHAETRIIQSQRVTESEQRERDKRAEKQAEDQARAIAMTEDLERQLLAIDTRTLAQKQALLEAEYEMERQKVIKTISIANGQAKALETLDKIRIKKHLAFNQAEIEINREKSFKTIELGLETLSIINSMEGGHTAAAVTRARVILALEKAIAIARLWAAEAGKGVAGLGLATAGTALIVAQFAQQSKAIGDAAKAANSGTGFSAVSTNLDIGAGSTYTEGEVSVEGTRTSGGATGGRGAGGSAVPVAGGGGSIVNVGGISVNLDVASLDLSAVDIVARRLREAVLNGTVEGVKMAVAIKNAAEKQSGLAV